MSIYGNIFRNAEATTPPVVGSDDAPIERQIAEVMAGQITGDAQFAGITAEQVIDSKRALRRMTEGDILVDCLAIGVRSTTLNRRRFRHDYITHAAIRCKLDKAKVTAAILNQLGLVSQAIQRFFEEQNRQLTLSPGGATLIKAEPFVHFSRELAFGDGVFLCPIEFTWTYKPGA